MIQNLRKIALVLDVSGTATALKNTRLYQGSFGFVGLQVYVPVTPNRSADSMPLCTVHRVTIDGEGVRTQYDNEVYNLLYVDTAILNGNEYLLFERPLPKTFTDIEGDLEIVINYSEIRHGAIVDGEKIKPDVITSRLATNIYETTVYAGGTPETDLEIDIKSGEAAQINANTTAIEEINENIAEAIETVGVAENAAQVAAEAAIVASGKVSKKTTTGLFVYSHNGGEEGEIAVEDTPTNDSDNLVKSGGIKTELDSLNSAQAAAIAQAVADILGGETTYDTLKKIVDLIGAANGIAPLDGDSKIPSTYLPSYVDDILEYDNLEGFPSPGETGKIYVAKDTNLTYRWSGSAYVEISKSLAIGETSSTAFRGDYGKALYDFAQSAIAGGLLKTQLDSKLSKADKYTAPITINYNIADEDWKWDYSLGDNANITMIGSEATQLTITNATAGDIGVLTVKGGQLTLPANSVPSADLGQLTAVGNQYYRYSFYFNGTDFEWHRTVLGEEDD